MATSYTIPSVLSWPSTRATIRAANEANRRMIRSGIYGRRVGTDGLYRPRYLSNSARQLGTIGTVQRARYGIIDSAQLATRVRPRYPSDLIDTARFAPTIKTRRFAHLVDTRPVARRLIGGIELDSRKRLARTLSDEISRPYARQMEQLSEQLLAQHREALQRIARNAFHIEPRTLVTMRAAVARAVPVEVPEVLEASRGDPPALDANDIAMLALLLTVVQVAIELSDDIRDVIVWALASYVLLSHAATRAALKGGLRRLQGRD